MADINGKAVHIEGKCSSCGGDGKVKSGYTWAKVRPANILCTRCSKEKRVI